MTVSGSTDYNPAAVSIITNARRLLGINAEEESLEANELTIGLEWLTMLLKDWQVDPELGTWLKTEGAMALVSADKDYVFGAGGSFTTVPFEISSIRVSYNGGNEIPMRQMGRDEYFNLPNKTSTGFPTCYFYDRQRDSGMLYVWPVPGDNNYDIAFTYRRRIMDTDAGTDSLDIPPEWMWAVTNNLAVNLIPTCGRGGTPEATQIVMEAGKSLAKLKNFDESNDGGEIQFVPVVRGRRYG